MDILSILNSSALHGVQSISTIRTMLLFTSSSSRLGAPIIEVSMMELLVQLPWAASSSLEGTSDHSFPSNLSVLICQQVTPAWPYETRRQSLIIFLIGAYQPGTDLVRPFAAEGLDAS